MKASEVRQRFIEYFERHGHTPRPSSSVVPADDPTLLFTNSGMVQFKRAFLGESTLPFVRAVTSQKCLRVSGKHNDLEEVGVTPRHHTFFEMLGNFSFGDYFKEGAIQFAWELLTEEYGIPADRLWATVHYSDDEASDLWRKVAGLPDYRILRLGDEDNFWQMGETGPCGPCSEVHYDARPNGTSSELSVDDFVKAGEQGDFLEIWNLVFMQYDRGADGELNPLPAPSIDTGAGLERLASVLQGVKSNYDTDVFLPLIQRAVQVIGVPYEDGTSDAVSYRVLADHARAVAFLLADGVFPSNEGRGYVLRRILRRAVRHAWLLGRREPTLVEVVDQVVQGMGHHFPELRHRHHHLLRVSREEEERFLATIGQGMERFDEVAPHLAPDVRAAVDSGSRPSPVVAAEDAFRLYDTFGFPLDLTEMIARERGYAVDVEGFEEALDAQRERSRKDRRAAGLLVDADELSSGWEELDPAAEQEFVGHDAVRVETDVVAYRREDGKLALQLRTNPFYAEAGGQVSDRGVVSGDGWRLSVNDVRRVGGRVAVIGEVQGDFRMESGQAMVVAEVEESVRLDTERNHTATHLLHSALRKHLGDHVVQRGSLVSPERLRFDFSHPRPLSAEELNRIEESVNEAIFAGREVCADYRDYREALESGVMALFGEKYEEVVRVVEVPGVSAELCGGTHVRNTAEIGMLRITGETGVAAGVRRIEAITGEAAYRRIKERDDLLDELADMLKTGVDNLPRKVRQLMDENRRLQAELTDARATGAADMVDQITDGALSVEGVKVAIAQVDAAGTDELRELGDTLRKRLGSGVAVLSAKLGKRLSLFVVVTDDLVSAGCRADELVRELAAIAGGGGGGRPHMAQGGVGDPERLEEALERVPEVLRDYLERVGAS